MRFNLAAIAFFLAAAILQASLGDNIAVLGIKPSLTFIAVYGLSITGGEGKGLFYGAVGGFVEDCLSGGYPGLFLSGYALAGALAGRAGKRVFNIGESANFGGIFILSLIQGIYSAVLMHTFIEGYDEFGMVWRAALPQALYNAAAGIFVLWLFKEQLARRAPWLKAIRQLQVRL